MKYIDYVNYLEENPFIGNQEQCGKGKDYWNADYWTIEVARYLHLGKDYHIPDKFKNNIHCDINRIRKDANIKLSLKSILEEQKNEASVLLIGEVGRGLDILISNSVKKWDKIFCYDQVDYSEYLKIFDNVEFIQKTTHVYDPTFIDIQSSFKYIFIINHSIHIKFDKFHGAIHGIINGRMSW